MSEELDAFLPIVAALARAAPKTQAVLHHIRRLREEALHCGEPDWVDALDKILDPKRKDDPPTSVVLSASA